MQNGDDAKDDFENDEWETLATVVDKILAWEKKLYDEVKVHLIPFFFFNSWPMNFYILDWFYGSSIMLPLKLKFYSCWDYALATYSKEVKSWTFRKFPIYFKVQLLLISIQIGLVHLRFFFSFSAIY